VKHQWIVPNANGALRPGDSASKRPGLRSRRIFLKTSAATTLLWTLQGAPPGAGAAGSGSSRYPPVIVIGSGLGGLCSAAYLARHGYPVTLFEQQSQPGGYATSFARAEGKYNFEISLHGVATRNNALARALRELGILDKIELVELSEVLRLKTPQLEITIPQRRPDNYIRVLTHHFPTEQKGIKKFINELVGIAAEADKLHRKGSYSRLLFGLQYPKMNAARKKNLREFLSKYVRHPALRNILAAFQDFHGLPPSRVSALYYGVVVGECLQNGTYYVKNRSQFLSRLLVRTIEKAGGGVRMNQPVKRILVSRNRVTGVELKSGMVAPARVVVSNVNPPTTFNRLLSTAALSRAFRRQLSELTPSLSTFIVWLGLNREIRGALPACGYYVISSGGPESEYRACLRGDIEHIPYRVSLFDNMHPDYSRPGTSTLKIFCLSGFEPWRRFAADYLAGRKESYYQQKKRWTDTLIKRVEHDLFPRLTSLIEITEAASPLTNRRLTANTGGAVYGFEQSMLHAYIDRIDHRTPLKGLYLAGAWTAPGGGFLGAIMSGRMAYRKILADKLS